MALLAREEWYGVAQKLNWTFSYVKHEEVFPKAMTGESKVPMEAWEDWDEPYKMTYREYVETQRDKDGGAYAVKSALSKAKITQQLGPGWNSILKAHYGAIAVAEYAASIAEARMARFGLDSAWRNTAVFGSLDEVRHGQIQLYFPHELVRDDIQFDWAHKALHTEDWASIAIRALFDDMFLATNVLDTAIQLPYSFETGFTNLQFLGMAADAMDIGDYNFSSLMSSIQTDESRHAQIGEATIQIMAKYDKEQAQFLVDKMFWKAWRTFALLTGSSMDYYTPLEHRKSSFKEFMEEWIIDQFIQSIEAVGLKKPWYWDQFIYELDHTVHALHLGVYFWRPTVWWNPPSGMSLEERHWLASKYPQWEETYGQYWDVIIDNYQNGRMEKTLPQTLPVVCACDQLPICETDYKTGKVAARVLTYKGKKYHFCSDVCQWIFESQPERFAGQKTIVDRFIEGRINPPTLEGALAYMGLSPHDMGKDPANGAWAFEHGVKNPVG
ncbi:YHS domain-containing protein [Bacillus benzoevorans]|uniref:propane 2-monooxygenase n=1 Tax=Bacillus benzoevorans TaxID=1456 RepID=A0A7X0HR00_9BACI|nr:YHS domain-containing protein [Bacillus benzoevorans]MBB6444152.1 toluene monooxygenase system protein A [Bacillus benzoevorans]